LRTFQFLAKQAKQIECLYGYFHHKTADETIFLTPKFQKRNFGPPFPDNWIFIGPFGIDNDSTMKTYRKQDSVFTKDFIQRGADNFRALVKTCGDAEAIRDMTEEDIFDALNLHMTRISTIDIANASFVIEQAAMPSLRGSFHSLASILRICAEQLPAGKSGLKNEISGNLSRAEKILNADSKFADFDRMTFITNYLMPLSGNLVDLQKALKIPYKNRLAALRAGARNVYAANVFNPDFFAPGSEAYLSNAKIELGKFLFFDPILSDNNERACASCHKPEMAFTDGMVKSVNFEMGDLPRNAPTVINSGFQKLQFWDLRATSLEDQLDSVINSKDELHSSFERVIERINSSDEYKQLFYSAFPESKKTGITRNLVKIAIACYERSLTGLNSRFDQYMRGDQSKMNDAEIRGFNLFTGKALCGTCHYAPLFNGAMPPYFEFTDHRSIGVPLKDTMDVYQVDPDTGASKPFAEPFFMFSFKIPTVRNAELTAPYMHNGVFKTLEQVIDFYDGAGGVNFTNQMRPGMKGLPFFMIFPEKLNLSVQEKKDLVSFIKTLNDTTAAKTKPTRLPELGGEFSKINKRIIGGVY
ncbi:MAG: hypothetical protein H7Y27_15645, partial [Gemmatimonadaceae bacterium]|nr:hypothetical protein [Chitinophagaceae bacterium]